MDPCKCNYFPKQTWSTNRIFTTKRRVILMPGPNIHHNEKLVTQFHKIGWTEQCRLTTPLAWCTWTNNICLPVIFVTDEGVFPATSLSKRYISTFCKLNRWMQCPVTDIIYQTQKTVFDHISKHPEESWKYDAHGVFWRTARCLEMWSNTVLSVWYNFSIKTKTREKTEK